VHPDGYTAFVFFTWAVKPPNVTDEQVTKEERQGISIWKPWPFRDLPRVDDSIQDRLTDETLCILTVVSVMWNVGKNRVEIELRDGCGDFGEQEFFDLDEAIECGWLVGLGPD
jgi:hypothetical protein